LLFFSRRRRHTRLVSDWSSDVCSSDLIPKYSELVYNGFWFSPEREALQALVSETQRNVTGLVRLKLYKGNIIVAGRKSPKSLYRSEEHTSELQSLTNLVCRLLLEKKKQ